MRLILTALIFVGGLFMILFALGFLFQPAETGASLGIAATNALGKAAIRADMTAFFGVTGITMLWGAWKRSGDILLVPALAMLLALMGRLVALATDGGFDGVAIPMLAEGALLALLVLARNMLPHHKVENVGE